MRHSFQSGWSIQWLFNQGLCHGRCNHAFEEVVAYQKPGSGGAKQGLTRSHLEQLCRWLVCSGKWREVREERGPEWQGPMCKEWPSCSLQGPSRMAQLLEHCMSQHLKRVRQGKT